MPLLPSAVPPGFTITTDLCTYFYDHGKTYPDDLGPAVDAVQLLLAEAGHDVSGDGRFGASTEQAVVDFQIDRGLRTDGVVGLQTWSELLAP